MKVQFAVDCISLAKGIELANQIRDYIEIIELGEEFIAKYGHMAPWASGYLPRARGAASATCARSC